MGNEWRARNRVKSREWQKTYRLKNKDKFLAGYKASYKTRRDVLHNLKNVPCTRCGGVFHPVCMDFHHRDPSTKSFAISRTWTVSLAKLQEEISKCDLLCANCHRMVEYVEQEG
jgi:hypothetical protein